jgi:acetylornithine deacetylase/succinyl-diaminopimelate desuccinylase-like protein
MMIAQMSNLFGKVDAMSSMTVDWTRVAGEISVYLQTLLRCKTVNPPGNETLAAESIRAVLEAEGIDAAVLESAPGRGNLIARLKAENPVAPPLLLMGHTDVVPVEREKWTADPFGGEIRDGAIWGRGALDMKAQVGAEMMTMVLLKRLEVPLDRDLIFAAFADEEVGHGNHGAAWIWWEHPEMIDAEFAINEGGGGPADVNGTLFFPVQTGEKGTCRMRLITTGPAGHASVPLSGTAIEKMGVALTRIHARHATTRLTPTVKAMLQSMAVALGERAQDFLEALEIDPGWDFYAGLPLDETMKSDLRAMLTDTVVPTILRGGRTINVIPSEVTLDLDCRTLPGPDPERIRQEIQDLVGDLGEVAITDFNPAIENDLESPLLDVIRETMAEMVPGSVVSPLLLTGGTDAKSLPGLKVHGFFPYRSVEQVERYVPLFHAHDERIEIDDLVFGTRVLFEIVRRFCQRPG